MLFNGEVAIVTGAAQGIGKAIAAEFCKEGAKAAIFDVNDTKGKAAADEITSAGGNAKYFRCDVSRPAEIEQAVAEVVRVFGTVNILVNNAGILHSTPIEDVTEEEWDKMMAVNLKSVFFMTQKVLPFFKQQGGGKIVNLSSLAGRMGGFANGLGYSASKAGIIGLTYGFAYRLAKYNINVNAVAPGTTETDILKALAPERVQQIRETIPIKRLGKPEDTANLVIFLASSKASFMTGAVVDINGGMFMG